MIDAQWRKEENRAANKWIGKSNVKKWGKCG